MKRVILSLCAATLLSGCSTVMNRSTQRVQVVTPGIMGAECHLRNDHHHYMTFSPDKVRVEKTKYDLVVTCSKEGYRDAEVNLPAMLAPEAKQNWTTLGLGFVYDTKSGAAYEYPESIEVAMQPVENVEAYEARKKWTWLEDWDSKPRNVDQNNIPDMSRLYNDSEESGFYDFAVEEDGTIEIYEEESVMPPGFDAQAMEPSDEDAAAAPGEKKSFMERLKGKFKKPDMSMDFLKNVKPSETPAELN